MNCFKRIILLCILFIGCISIKSYGAELEYVQDYLNDIGVPPEYSINITEYINNLQISEDDIRNIVDDSIAVFSNIQDNMNYNEMSIIEILNIYNNFVNISDKLNIDFNIDFDEGTVEFKDNNNGNILLNCRIDELQSYIDTYDTLGVIDKDKDKEKIFETVKNKVDSAIQGIRDDDLSFEFKQAKIYVVIFACGAIAILIGWIIK